MVLSPQQEGDLIQKYEKLIWRTIHRYLKDTGNPLISKEDCFQECSIVLLDKIRRMASVDDLKTQFPFLDMIRSMRYLIVRNQSFRYPKDPSRLKKIILAKEAKKLDTPSEDLGFIGIDDTDIEDVPAFVDFERFFEGLGELEQKVVSGKLCGLRNRDIAQRLGLSDVKVTRILQRTLKKYRAECSE